MAAWEVGLKSKGNGMKKQSLLASAILVPALFVIGMASFILVEPFTRASANAGVCCSSISDNCGGDLVCCDYMKLGAVSCSRNGLPDYCRPAGTCN